MGSGHLAFLNSLREFAEFTLPRTNVDNIPDQFFSGVSD